MQATMSYARVCTRPRRRAARGFAVALVAAIAVAGAAPQPAEAARSHERQLYNSINKERVRRHRVKLRLSGGLSKVARQHSKNMARKDVLRHRSDLTDGIRGEWRVIGENVGYGGSIRSLHRAFMRSKPHRRNVLYRKYRHVGVGVVRDGDGTLWVTVIFKG